MGEPRHRDQRVVFYVTATELEAMKGQARAAGFTGERDLSEWMRQMLLGSALEQDGRTARWRKEEP